MFEQNGWNFHGCLNEKLFFNYFDNENKDAYRRGETIRQVGEFNGREGIYRYDFKIGPITDRLGGSYWSDEQYFSSEVAELLGLPQRYSSISMSASARTNHLKLYFEKNGTHVEVTHDIFDVVNGSGFKELEIELEAGDVEEFEGISRIVQSTLGLKSLDKQKYSRVIESMY